MSTCPDLAGKRVGYRICEPILISRGQKCHYKEVYNTVCVGDEITSGCVKVVECKKDSSRDGVDRDVCYSFEHSDEGSSVSCKSNLKRSRHCLIHTSNSPLSNQHSYPQAVTLSPLPLPAVIKYLSAKLELVTPQDVIWTVTEVDILLKQAAEAQCWKRHYAEMLCRHRYRLYGENGHCRKGKEIKEKRFSVPMRVRWMNCRAHLPLRLPRPSAMILHQALRRTCCLRDQLAWVSRPWSQS